MITFRKSVPGRENDGTSYESWGDAVTARITLLPAGGRLQIEQYGERAAYMMTGYVHDMPLQIAESDGALIKSTVDPDYRVVSIQSWGDHAVLTLEAIKR